MSNAAVEPVIHRTLVVDHITLPQPHGGQICNTGKGVKVIPLHPSKDKKASKKGKKAKLRVVDNPKPSTKPTTEEVEVTPRPACPGTHETETRRLKHPQYVSNGTGAVRIH